MSVSHEPTLGTDATVARVLRGARVNDASSLPKQHTHRTPECVAVSRAFAVAMQGARWTAAEQRHLEGCAFCQNVFGTLNGTPYQPATDDETTIITASADETTHIETQPQNKPGSAPPNAG